MDISDLLSCSAEAFLNANLEDGASPPYIRSDFRFRRCLLCNQWVIGLHHLSGDEHKKKLEELRVKLPLALNLVKRWLACHDTPDNTVAMLNEGDHASWKDALHAELYRFMVEPTSVRAEEADRLEQTLQEGLANERWAKRLVPLALAVWKAQCQEAATKPETTSFLELLAWQKEWATSGWKHQKDEHRKSKAINIILSPVRPFLE
jgi:hypothetical protein